MIEIIEALESETPIHMVLTYRETRWPFTKGWMCSCGKVFKSTYMGPSLVREFREHQEE